jgi:hemerythrin-like domain-containing protein
MSTRNGSIIVDATLAEAYNAAPKTRKKQALSAMRQVLRPRKERKVKVPHLSKKETELFLRINRSLSEEQRRRIEELNEKIEESTITEEEHAELLRLVEMAERLSVDRLRAIVALAKLRKMSPEALMRQLEM